jgi:Ca2+-binding RTX toxin-like protein
MAVLTVGPDSTYPTVAAAMAAASPFDTISLEAGYSFTTATVTVDNLFVTGEASSTHIHLYLGDGVNTVTLLGDASISVFDNTGNNTITGNDGPDFFTVTDGIDVVHGGLGIDHLTVDYSSDTSSIIGTTVSITDGGTHSVTFDGIENFKIDTGSGNDTLTVGDGTNVINTNAGNDTITAGNGGDRINAGIGNDTVTAGDGLNKIIGGGGDDTLTGGNGHNFVNGGAGDDIITTGDHFDVIYAGLGDDTISSGGGQDRIFLTGGTDTVDGGSGRDTVDYSGMSLAVDVSLANAGAQAVNANATDTLTSIENLTGSAFDDTLTGTTASNVLTGGLGADQLIGGGGADTFAYGSVADSTSTAYDVITGFAAGNNKFDLWFTVNAVDTAVTAGALSTSTFDTDLASAVGSSQLGAHDAVLFTANSGSLAGHTFLVVDANGIAGYQAGADLVIELADATHLGNLSAANFI